MSFEDKLERVQKNLNQVKCGAWILYDFRRSNDLACRFLEIPAEKLITRRFYYFIPANGTPIKIVHRIESSVLDHLPGNTITYSSWEELNQALKTASKGIHRAAMEYSPLNAIPTISKVDAGTVDLIRSFGIEVVSSADILQQFSSVWNPYQLETHFQAAEILDRTVGKAWQLISDALLHGKHLTEFDVQCFILKEFAVNECMCEDPPICAVNAHSANPHYIPESKASSTIKKGDFILIDLWCKLKKPGAVYADITRVGVAAPKPTTKQYEIFSIVRNARDAALNLLKERLKQKKSISGSEVDQVCRDVISNSGYGKYFTHRTGHNIGERDHGDGANIDNFETKDSRLLLPGTCFSIEPGIYLPGEFGVRLEHNVYLDIDGRNMHVTGGLQEEITTLV